MADESNTAAYDQPVPPPPDSLSLLPKGARLVPGLIDGGPVLERLNKIRTHLAKLEGDATEIVSTAKNLRAGVEKILSDLRSTFGS